MKLERPIVRVGNSAGVVLPREWLNGRARVELIERPLDVRKDIFRILEPYLEDVIGIYLVGSYARGEQTEESDVDVLVISGSTAKTIRSGKYEIVVSPLASVLSVLKERPELAYFKIMEAEVIMNKGLLEELKGVKLSKKDFGVFFKESRRMLKLSRNNLALDKKEGEFLKSGGVVYSLVLRLRGIFMIECLLKGRKYSNRDFGKWIVERVGIGKREYGEIMGVYRAVRDEKKIKMRVEFSVVEKLFRLLEEELRKYG